MTQQLHKCARCMYFGPDTYMINFTDDSDRRWCSLCLPYALHEIKTQKDDADTTAVLINNFETVLGILRSSAAIIEDGGSTVEEAYLIWHTARGAEAALNVLRRRSNG